MSQVSPQAGERAFQSHISLMLTRRCNIRCRHCCVDALPSNASGGDVTEQDLRAWVLQATQEPKVTHLSLTGGEPFLVFPLLRQAAELAVDQGLAVGVVTSGFWALTVNAARRKLAPLARLGRQFTLSLSVDRFHQEYVPLDRIRNAIVAAHELGIDQIKIKLGYLGFSAEQCREWLLANLGPVPVPFTVELQLVHRTGRATRQISRDEFAHEKERYEGVDTNEVPCTMADFPLITPEGQVYACCGVALLLRHETPLLLGNLQEKSLHEILDGSEANIILHFIRLYGPLRLFRYAGRKVKIRDCDATSLCNLCLRFFALPRLVAELGQQLEGADWQAIRRQIAVHRLLYRGEPQMLARMSP